MQAFSIVRSTMNPTIRSRITVSSILLPGCPEAFKVFWAAVVTPSDLLTVALLIALEGLLSADNAMVLAVLVLDHPAQALARPRAVERARLPRAGLRSCARIPTRIGRRPTASASIAEAAYGARCKTRLRR